jgi:hypothetical protein
MSEGDYVSGSVTIEGYGPLQTISAEDLFSPDSPPVITCISSGGGKTISAVASVYANRKKLTGLFYICNSYGDPRNTYLQTMIPSIHVRNFSIETISEIWGDILRQSSEAGMALRSVGIEEFVRRRCGGNSDYIRTMDDLRRRYDEAKEKFPSGEAMDSAFRVYEQHTKMLYIRNHFSLSDQSLSLVEASIVKWCQSSTPLPVIVFDDVTAQLATAVSGKFSIPQINEQQALVSIELSGNKARDFLLTSILTTMRRNGVAAFFVHKLSAFEATVRQQFNALVLDGTGIDELFREKIITEEGKGLIATAWSKLTQYQKEHYHRIVYTVDPSSTPHGQRVAVYKAPKFSTPEPLGSPTYNYISDRILSASRSHNQQSAISSAATAIGRNSEEEKRRNLLEAAKGMSLSPSNTSYASVSAPIAGTVATPLPSPSSQSQSQSQPRYGGHISHTSHTGYSGGMGLLS